MLGLMRRHSRSIIIKLVYVGLILSFLVWGIGSYKSRKDYIAVSVDGEKITFSEYQRSFENLINYYRETLKDGFNEDLIVRLNLKKQALDSLIDRLLLLKEAGRLKLKVDKKEVRERIRNYPAFQKDGRFDEETYFKVLNYNRVKPGDFEREQRDLILMAKAENIIKSSAAVTDEEVMADYRREKTTVNIEFVKITPERFEKRTKASIQEMKDYFSAHMGEFTIPEKVRLGYAIFAPKSFLKEIKLTREDYEDYYKSYIDDFTVPRKVRARHILVKFGSDKQEARARAEGLLSRAREGEDFSKLAGEHSEDPGSAKKGGDLGFFARGEMVKAFEDAAFSMEKGDVSDLVESVYGFHIIKVEDIAEEKVRPLAEVKPEIRAVLEAEISRELAEGRAEDIYYEALKGKSLEELVREEKLPYKTTDFFALKDIPPELEALRDAVQAASSMDVGWMGRPTEAGEKFFILTLLGKEQPREPNFNEVKDQVKSAVKGEKARKAASELGEKILAQAKKEKSLRKAARKHNLKVEETGHFSRSRNFVPDIGVSLELVAKAFELTADNPLPDDIYKVGDNVIVFALKGRKEIKQEDFDRDKERFREKLLSRKREEVYRKWLEEARRKADIAYHEDFLELQG